MTSLLPRSVAPGASPGAAPGDTGDTGDTGARPGAAAARRRGSRSLAAVATLGGVAAAGLSLLACLAVAVVGWYLTDAGAHGTPRDALRVGALGWLVGHGSGVAVRGTTVTVLPLGLTLLCAWASWRTGHRVGDGLSGHGPDADRIADGERDWTVPAATALFAVGYAVVTGLVGALAADPTTAPSVPRAMAGGLLLATLVGGTAVAVGSGRAAIWLAVLPPLVRLALATARTILLWQLAAAAVLLTGALALEHAAVVGVVADLGADAGDAVLLVLLVLLALPTALLLALAWLLGPGFAVGTGTVVSPALTVLGPLPLLPLVPALPAEGTWPRAWSLAVVAVPFVLAALAAAGAQRRIPSVRWDEGVLRGCVGGVAAGVAVGLLAALAGGALGPGRMAEVGPPAGQVLVHAVAALGLGGALGAAVATGWQRRSRRSSEQETEQ